MIPGTVRGRVVIALLSLVAFCASYAAPVPTAINSCCSSKSKSCCKRTHGPGWVATNSSCAGQCACEASSAPAVVVADTARAGGTAAETANSALITSPDTPDHRPTILYQRPPPTID
jgi:hypothetical protein